MPRFFPTGVLVPTIVLAFLPAPARAQGTPPLDASELNKAPALDHAVQGTPPLLSPPMMGEVKNMVKAQIRNAVDGKYYPSLVNWSPLTSRQKFDVFLASTYQTGTFVAAGVDAVRDDVQNSNPGYERGWRGLGQHYGVNLGTSETGVFFERFLIPTVLRQDPRYFRNPALPFFKRALYSLSRVIITRADSGHNTFNASKITGGAAAQALADLYVPGERQGLHPLADRVTFDLARDAGFNLVHEFWPDIRRKVFRNRKVIF